MIFLQHKNAYFIEFLNTTSITQKFKLELIQIYVIDALINRLIITKVLMKKILTIVTAILFASASAYAEIRIGFSGAFTGLSTDGTETTKSSGEKNTGTRDEDVVVPSLFLEYSPQGTFAFGLDIVPGEAELGSGTGADLSLIHI